MNHSIWYYVAVMDAVETIAFVVKLVAVVIVIVVIIKSFKDL